MLCFFSSSTTKQKVYMARFWLPLYSAVVMSMYAYDTLLTYRTSACCRLHRSLERGRLSVRPHRRARAPALGLGALRSRMPSEGVARNASVGRGARLALAHLHSISPS